MKFSLFYKGKLHDYNEIQKKETVAFTRNSHGRKNKSEGRGASKPLCVLTPAKRAERAEKF